MKDFLGKIKKAMFIFLGVGLLAAGCLWFKDIQNMKLQRELARQVVRFRILANSNREEDQQLKLKIRDSILQQIQPWVEPAVGKTAVCAALENHMAEIENQAAKTATENGCFAPITVSLEKTTFPDKLYGECFFPKGVYEALVVRIGEAKGKNWWCMLYPALCFRDALHPVVSQKQQQVLKKVLPEEIYEGVTREKIHFTSFFFHNPRKKFT